MATVSKPLRIGTRGSPLALAQAAIVRDALAAAHPDLPRGEIVVMHSGKFPTGRWHVSRSRTAQPSPRGTTRDLQHAPPTP